MPIETPDIPQTYLVYLLRLWQVREGNTVLWRAALENTRANERLAFTDLNALFDYLQAQTNVQEG